MQQLVLTIKSRDAHERIVATLTLLKLCRCKLLSDPVYVADYVWIRRGHAKVFFTAQGSGYFHAAVGTKGDFAAGSVRVEDLYEIW